MYKKYFKPINCLLENTKEISVKKRYQTLYRQNANAKLYEIIIKIK